jgi:hypothetical protein
MVSAFGAGSDALEHAAFRHEAHWLDKVPERRLSAWIAEALSGYQPGAPAVVDAATLAPPSMTSR